MLLEGQLNNFSFEELTMEEAAQLKKSFIFFKNRLEEKVLGVKLTEDIQTSDVETVDSPEAMGSLTNTTVEIKDESLLVKLYHDFRNRVNEILGFTDLMKEGPMDDPEQRAQIMAVSKIADNLSGILNELQEYIALATGKEKFEEIHFNLSRIVKDSLFLCNALIVHKEVRLSVEIDKKIPKFLIGDPSQLSQILLYLLGNTIKYVNEGNIHLRIMLEEDCGDSCSLQFRISHRGRGKSQTEIVQFYSSLTQSETAGFGKFSDNGFGPYIIKQLIGNLNGSIPIARTMESTSAFLFDLPYAKGAMRGKTHLGKIWQECSGEVDLLEELIALFKRNALEYIGKLKIYLPLGDFEKIQAASQKMRASACLVQADSLLPIIDALFDNCGTVRDIHHSNRLYDQFIATYPSLESTIDEELKHLKTHGKF